MFFDLIPKNATSSILNSLVNYDNKSYNGEIDEHIYIHLPKDIPSFNLNKDLFFNEIFSEEDTVKFTCIRDPYMRVVSAYVNKILYGISTDIIKDFFDIYGSDMEVFRNDKKKYFDIFVDFIVNSEASTLDEHIRPQSMLLHFDFNKYDYVFNTNSISSDWKELQRIFPKMPKLPESRVNRTDSFKFIDEIGDLGLKRIKSIYADDYQMMS